MFDSGGLSATEKRVCSVMMTEFVPLVKVRLMKGNLIEYRKWQGNCCMQMAVFGCAVLTDMLPGYDWVMWIGEFKDKIEDRKYEYNHAWIYGLWESKGLLVDMARNHKQNLFIRSNINRFPMIPGYLDQVVISREQADWRELLLKKEYYTDEYGYVIVEQILNRLK